MFIVVLTIILLWFPLVVINVFIHLIYADLFSHGGSHHNASNNGSIFNLHDFGKRTIQFPYKYAMETHGNTVEIDCLKSYHSV